MTSVTKPLRPTPFRAGIGVILLSCLLWYSFGYEKPLLFSAIDEKIVDAMFRLRGQQPTTGQVVIVDIDERSLKEHGQWPWPRHKVAELTRRIAAAEPLVIGFDILFAESDRTSPATLLNAYRPLLDPCPALERLLADPAARHTLDHDLQLAEALELSPTVLGYMFLFREDNLKVADAAPFPSLDISIVGRGTDFSSLRLVKAYRPLLNIAQLNASSQGFFNVFPDQGGTVRKVPLFLMLDGLPYPSLAFEMFRLGIGEQEARLHPSEVGGQSPRPLLGVSLGRQFIRTDDFGHLAVNFRGPYNTFPYLPAAEVMRGQGVEGLRGKYVLVGSSASGLMDLITTPFSSRLPGVEAQANVIDNLIAGDAMAWENYTEIGLTYALIAGAGLLMVLALVHLGPFAGFTVGLSILGGIVVGVYNLLFLRHQMLGISYILLSLLAVFMTVTLFNYVFEGRRKSFIRRAFSHYLAPSVVGELLRNPEKLNLTVESRQVTVLFCDIRNFTSLSETTPAAQLGHFLNSYFSLLTEIIIKHQGMVDKYIGDAIMAVWNTPLDDPRHAANAVAAAMEMVETVGRGGVDLQLAGQAIEIGIGINTGMVSAGNFGSSRRFDYTVLGDNVNLASRIEGLTKYYRRPILLSESTRLLLPANLPCRYIDRVLVKGRNRAVDLFEPLAEEALREEDILTKKAYEAAVEDYLQGRFADARQGFARLRQVDESWLYQLYEERCTHLLANPPNDWQGIHRHG